jgi:hypothetical protein
MKLNKIIATKQFFHLKKTKGQEEKNGKFFLCYKHCCQLAPISKPRPTNCKK